MVIHEGQLTWQDEGFTKIVDLGVWWAEETDGLPLPLGGNVIRRDLGAKTCERAAACSRTRSSTRSPTATRRSTTPSTTDAVSTATRPIGLSGCMSTI